MGGNKQYVRLGKTNFLVVDLTETLRLRTEVYPGDPKPKRQIFSEIMKTGWEHYIFTLGDHNFHPHGDAPNHQNPDMPDEGFEKFNLGWSFNSACMIDLSNSLEAKLIEGITHIREIKREHLEPYKKQLLKVGAVVIRTGYDKWLEENKPHSPENLPYLHRDAAKYLTSFRKLKVIGVDSLTVDKPGQHDSHIALKDRLIVESLVHLYDIPKNVRARFDLMTAAVRIETATGGPIVAYAFIEQKKR